MFERAQFSIPIIGLEKMKETIVIPLSNTQFDHISLTNSSPALLLLQSIRNEAHRFSHAYSTRLRKKSLLK
jgi:excinuclease UvrABC nuclease subunit